MSEKPTGVRARAKERSRRLKNELEARGGTLRALQQAVRDACGPGTRGTSYGGVRAIVEGEIDHPRPDVVRALADALGVRFEYLWDLEGPRDPREMRESRAVAADEPDWDPYYDAIMALDGGVASLRGPWWGAASHDGGKAALKSLTVRLLECGGQSLENWPPDEIREAVVSLGTLLTLPARATHPNVLGRPLGRDDEYFQAMALAVRALIPPRADPKAILATLKGFLASMPSEPSFSLLDVVDAKGGES